MVWYFLWIYLFVLAIEDYKSHKISIILLIIPLIIKGIVALFLPTDPWSILVSCIPGFVLLLGGLLLPEKIGLADGLVFIVLGLWHQIGTIIAIFILALFLHSILGGIIILTRRKNLHYEMAFIPFVFMSYWCCWIGGLWI